MLGTGAVPGYIKEVKGRCKLDGGAWMREEVRLIAM